MAGKTIKALTPELREELLAMLRQELAEQEQQKRENRTMYQRINKDYQEAYKEFNFEKPLWKGTEYVQLALDVRMAVGYLLRAAFQVKRSADLPVNREAEIRQFMDAVLGLTREYYQRTLALKAEKSHPAA